jgi:acetoin utilization protein AcuB
MIALELINYNIPFLKPTDTVESALEMMDDFRIEQMVYSDGNQYLGVFSYSHLQSINDSNTKLSDIQPDHVNTYLNQNKHIIEIVNLVKSEDIQTIAVLDDAFNYKGSILLNDLIQKYVQLLGSAENGAIILISIEKLDYSLTEIARLIESNDVKIISSYYKTIESEGGSKNILTLKLNTQDISKVVATLERFGYNILETFANDPIESIEKERYEMLIKYLEI